MGLIGYMNNYNSQKYFEITQINLSDSFEWTDNDYEQFLNPPPSPTETIESPPSPNGTIESPPSQNETIESPPSPNETIESPPSPNETIESPPSPNGTIESPPSPNETIELHEELIEDGYEVTVQQNFSGLKRTNEAISNNPLNSDDKSKAGQIDKYNYDEPTKEKSGNTERSNDNGDSRNKKYRTNEQIYQIIKSNFINSYMIGDFNKKLKDENLPLKFRKLPKSFVKNVRKADNQKLMDKKLLSIFTSEDIYGKEKPKSYLNNLEVIESLKEKNHEIYKILTTVKFREHYPKYLLSETYEKNIDKIKNRHKVDIKYHNKFIKLSKNFVEYFTLKI